MKFVKNDSNPSYSGKLTLIRENSRFEIIRFSDEKVAFTNRLPRRGSKFWDKTDYLVWDLNNNEKAYPNKIK